ncbi:hypothetical protein OG426_41435 [Streptomyces canus]|nr:hypothetical protein [Streptomyces canus]MCX4856054.1 hypothetical protein [Streptomyces canus]WSW38455.1 hypothetical protein OG426_41435 [Streptomyces canus]
MAEFDVHAGAVHDVLVEVQRAWLGELERCAERVSWPRTPIRRN